MAVTRLERKGRVNKSRAKKRILDIKRLKSRHAIASPLKEESGIIIGDIKDIVGNVKAAPKAAPAAKKEAVKAEAAPAAKKEAAPKGESVSDDLTKIEGIGPKISQILSENGVGTFTALAGSNADSIKEILAAAGKRYAIHNPTTWPKQAAMAAAGSWDELKQWQDVLDGGVDTSEEE